MELVHGHDSLLTCGFRQSDHMRDRSSSDSLTPVARAAGEARHRTNHPSAEEPPQRDPPGPAHTAALPSSLDHRADIPAARLVPPSTRASRVAPECFRCALPSRVCVAQSSTVLEMSSRLLPRLQRALAQRYAAIRPRDTPATIRAIYLMTDAFTYS